MEILIKALGVIGGLGIVALSVVALIIVWACAFHMRHCDETE